MRAGLAIVGLSIALAVCGCLTPRPTAACPFSVYGPEGAAIFDGLQKLLPDPKGHHNLIDTRSSDARGNLVIDMTVWPLSGPQEPAPGDKVRVVLTPGPCIDKLVKVEKLAG